MWICEWVPEVEMDQWSTTDIHTNFQLYKAARLAQYSCTPIFSIAFYNGDFQLWGHSKCNSGVKYSSSSEHPLSFLP